MDDRLNGEDAVVRWLLEPENPSARYLTLTGLLDRPEDDAEVMAARAAILDVPPVRAILEAQYPYQAGTGRPGGFWIKPDVGYSPKYRATLWQVIFLAQYGAPLVPGVRAACEYVLEHSRRPDDGRFVAGHQPHSAILCLNGNILWALQRLGFGADARVQQARAAVAAEVARRGCVCRYNGDLECAWGAVKMLHALLEVPPGARSGEMQLAIERGVRLLLSSPLIEAGYPSRSGVSELWFRLAFPLTYPADVLDAVAALTAAGCGEHPHVRAAVAWLGEKRDAHGRWRLEQRPEKMWSSSGALNRPNKWVTLRVLRAQRAQRAPG